MSAGREFITNLKRVRKDQIEIGECMVEKENHNEIMEISTPVKERIQEEKGVTGLSKLPRAQKRSLNDTPFQSRIENLQDTP